LDADDKAPLKERHTAKRIWVYFRGERGDPGDPGGLGLLLAEQRERATNRVAY
jgi:hypothetical protein